MRTKILETVPEKTPEIFQGRNIAKKPKGKISKLVKKLGFSSAWEKHLEQMNHPRYPYFDVHQEALHKYGLNPNLPPDERFCSWKFGKKHNTCVSTLEEAVEATQRLTRHRKGEAICNYLPHFIAVKDQPSMIYLISYPKLECGFGSDQDFSHGFRSRIAMWIQLRGGYYIGGQIDHPDKLSSTTEFNRNFGGYLAYGTEILDRESEQEDNKFERPVYQYNREKIFRVVSDTSQFCKIVRAQYDPINTSGHNGYFRLEANLAQEIEHIAKSLALSEGRTGLIHAFSGLGRYVQRR